MKPAKPKLKEVAQRLLDYEVASGKSSGAKNSPAFRVCEKLRGPLGKLTGVAGYRSLLSRALALAGAEVPWLRGLHIRSDGSLEGLEDLETKHDPREIADGEAVLVGQLLGLLVTFIGSGLTQRLLHEVWPETDIPDL